MPTFTSIALGNLLEPKVRDSVKKHEPECLNPSRHLYVSPALYATPEQAPIPDHSSSLPSPYVANNKRRGRIPELGRCGDETEVSRVEYNFVNGDEDGVGEEDLDRMSELDAADSSLIQIESRTSVSAQVEFFDATDGFSSDGSISPYEYRLSELHTSRVNLLEEIEKRKNAEETLLSMLSQWEKIRILISEAGLTFPAINEVEDQFIDKIRQEVDAARFVANAVGRGVARAEAEEAAMAVNELKDQEILRLHDRLQYHETVNHEMSQRNLVEAVRRQQERKSRRRWVWSFLGMAISIGASLVAYSYISHTSGECMPPPLLESGDSAASDGH